VARATGAAGDSGASGSAEGPELPGPVDAGGEENEGSPAQQTASRSETSAPVERDDRAHGERRVGIGARRGRRGSTASHAGSPEGGDGSAGASHTGSSSDAAPEVAGDEPATGAVDHMVKNYAGVGRKTAEALVDAFGAEVFAVIDEDPSRITRVLPEHRAQAVIEAREAEREDAD